MKKATKTTIITGALKTIGKRNMAKVLTWTEAHPNGTGEALAKVTKVSVPSATRQLREARRVMSNNLVATVMVRANPEL